MSNVSRFDENFNQRERTPKKINQTYVENRLMNLHPQKYQYYNGTNQDLGAPFHKGGQINKRYTSPSFASSAIFYEHPKHHDSPKK